jgi:peptide/nickel transport system substrate-binding protein
LAQKANKWSSRNLTRWTSKEFDDAHKAAQVELDPVKRAALFVRMNDMVVNDGYIVPLFARPRPVGTVNKFAGTISAWDNLTAFMNSWYREA